jgi:hypothetical protein
MDTYHTVQKPKTQNTEAAKIDVSIFYVPLNFFKQQKDTKDSG